MIKVIEFLILIICITIACGIIAWAVRCENKQTKTKDKEKTK